MAATLHVMHGFIGVGKTTLARRLARRHDALMLSVDEWMQVLFGEDPDFVGFDDWAERCWVLMRRQTGWALDHGHDVVWDAGHWSRASRDQARMFAADHGADFRLYRVTCPDELARRRTTDRNKKLDPHSVFIAPEVYAALVDRFEPLHADEPCLEIDGRSMPDTA